MFHMHAGASMAGQAMAVSFFRFVCVHIVIANQFHWSRIGGLV